MTLIKYAALGDVAQYLRGINFKPDDVVPVGTEGAVACMRTKNIQGSLDCEDVWAVSEDFVRRPEQILKEGDILVSSANSWNLVGKCCWIPELPWKTTFGGFVSALRADTQKIDPRFLYWWFASDRTQALLRSFGQKTTSISNLNAERCLNLSVPIPPLPEQRRIAAILDQADALRAKRREALAQMDNLTQSIFIDMFGDPAQNTRNLPLISLDEAGKWHSGGTPPRSREDYFSGEIPWFSSGELEPMYVSDSAEKISPEALVETSAKSVLSGSLMLGMYDTAALKASIAATNCSCNQAIAFASIRRDLLETVYVYFAIVIGREHFRRLQRGVRQKNLNLELIRQIRIPLPPINTQRVFVEKVTKIGLLQKAQIQSLNHLDTLFVTLQHRAFRGEL